MRDSLYMHAATAVLGMLASHHVLWNAGMPGYLTHTMLTPNAEATYGIRMHATVQNWRSLW